MTKNITRKQYKKNTRYRKKKNIRNSFKKNGVKRTVAIRGGVRSQLKQIGEQITEIFKRKPQTQNTKEQSQKQSSKDFNPINDTSIRLGLGNLEDYTTNYTTVQNKKNDIPIADAKEIGSEEIVSNDILLENVVSPSAPPLPLTGTYYTQNVSPSAPPLPLTGTYYTQNVKPSAPPLPQAVKKPLSNRMFRFPSSVNNPNPNDFKTPKKPPKDENNYLLKVLNKNEKDFLFEKLYDEIFSPIIQKIINLKTEETKFLKTITKDNIYSKFYNDTNDKDNIKLKEILLNYKNNKGELLTINNFKEEIKRRYPKGIHK